MGCEPGPEFADVVFAYLAHQAVQRQEVFDAREQTQIAAMHAALKSTR